MNELWTQVDNAQITPLAALDSSVVEGNSNILCQLTDDAILRLSGPDAKKFLQGQVTCDVTQISATRSSMGAACTAKGKMVALFQLVMDDSENEPRYLIRVPSSTATALMAHLEKYIIFSRASVSISSEVCNVGLFAGASSSISGIRLPDNSGETLSHSTSHGKVSVTRIARHAPLFEVFGTQAGLVGFFQSCDTPALVTPPPAWRSIEIYQGIPRLEAEQVDKFVPQIFNLHYLNAISFQKGCYTGQEIVARIKYLGKEKKQLRVMQCEVPGHRPFSARIAGLTVEDSAHKKAGTVLRCSENIEGKVYLSVILNTGSDSKTEYFAPELSSDPLQLLELPY
ncbi:MAG: hypothetical protein CSB48_12855 [Proteobacteria bacterium]|nr:MAG: hypothetical protein CSB48_12855 [Pseudomonadota bacterium]PIE40310.1 MAG: hypothetical protein CSA51_01355 [Gammaproteobacteria bacterium]